MDKFTIRQITNTDFQKGYLDLLTQLTKLDPKSISQADFDSLINDLTDEHSISVIEDPTTSKIIGSATLLIERKFIHNMGRVGHIEDVIIDNSFRGHGLGKLLIESLTSRAHNRGCYKVILDCDESNVRFYEKCGFIKKACEMALYFA